MVHYRSDSVVDGSNYWKLGFRPGWGLGVQLKKELTQRNFLFRTTTKVPRLQELVRRAERGLISYEKCDKTQLLRFCKDRGIHIGANLPATKDGLIKTLEQADEKRAFDKFQDLAAELRVVIYELYVEDLATVGDIDATWPSPPIARVSKLLRRETLSIYRKACTLKIELTHTRKFKIHLTEASAALCRQISDKQLKDMKKHVISVSSQDSGLPKCVSYHIDLHCMNVEYFARKDDDVQEQRVRFETFWDKFVFLVIHRVVRSNAPASVRMGVLKQ